MTKVGEVYLCEVCGNKVKVLEAGKGTLVSAATHETSQMKKVKLMSEEKKCPKCHGKMVEGALWSYGGIRIGKKGTIL